MRYLLCLSTLLLIQIKLVYADRYQEKLCSEISKGIKQGDIIPNSCKEIFKQSSFFKQASSADQNLGVWVKNNMLYIVLEKKIKGNWKIEEKIYWWKGTVSRSNH